MKHISEMSADEFAAGLRELGITVALAGPPVADAQPAQPARPGQFAPPPKPNTAPTHVRDMSPEQFIAGARALGITVPLLPVSGGRHMRDMTPIERENTWRGR